MTKEHLKPAAFAKPARKAVKSFPKEVRDSVGFAIEQVQRGIKPASAKPLKGFGGADVLEIVDNYDGDTFRAVYTVRFAELVYVLHCFQKKSKKGIATPKKEIELIRARLRDAETFYEEWLKDRDKK